VDARLLAHFGTHHQPPCWQPPKAIDTALKQWEGLRQVLDNQRVQLCNQAEAYALDPQAAEEVLAMQQAQIQHLEGQIKALDKKVDALVKQHYAVLNKKLRSIPGIGPRAATILLATTAGFTRFENAKQLASFVGIAPRVIQSGKMKMRSVSICKMGQGRLRQILYMAAISASQHNPGCKALFERLTQRGKPFKVALIAVAHKLLRQAFAVARFNQPFDPKLSLAQRTPNTCLQT
jgi:transposase